MNETHTLSDVIERWLEFRLQDLRVAIPAKVDAVNAAAQTVDVVVQIQEETIDEDGNIIHETPAKLSGIPYGNQRVGKWFQWMPPSKGDHVTLLVCDRSLDQWRAKGRESPNADGRFNDLSDAVAVPLNVYPSADPLSNASGTDMVLGKDDGSRITFKANGDIELGSSVSDYVALAQAVLDELEALNTHLTAIEAVISGEPIAEPGLGAPSALQTALAAAITGSPLPTPGSVAASKVKAE